MTLSVEERSRLKVVLMFNTVKESCVRKSEELTLWKILGILQTVLPLPGFGHFPVELARSFHDNTNIF